MCQIILFKINKNKVIKIFSLISRHKITPFSIDNHLYPIEDQPILLISDLIFSQEIPYILCKIIVVIQIYYHNKMFKRVIILSNSSLS